MHPVFGFSTGRYINIIGVRQYNNTIIRSDGLAVK